MLILERPDVSCSTLESVGIYVNSLLSCTCHRLNACECGRAASIAPATQRPCAAGGDADRHVPGRRCVDHTSHHSPAESGNSREGRRCSNATPVLPKHNSQRRRTAALIETRPVPSLHRCTTNFFECNQALCARRRSSVYCVFSGSELTRIKQCGLVCVRMPPQFGIRREMNMLITPGKASVTGPCRQELVHI
jgi:hypothetical protein